MTGGRTTAMVPVVALMILALGINADQGPIVVTKNGPLIGEHAVYSDGRPYDVFKGIPFAKPPVKDLRWKRPEPVSDWSGVYNATYFRTYCPQLTTPLYAIIGMNHEDSEDCLYLNVFVPVGVESASKLPVMFWIYGGAFRMGASDMYSPQELALNGSVVIVTINYRVDTLGFMSTGNSAARGNYGLWDQVAGLRWVQDNIAAFGGDPDRVTIFGQSAGGASVSHLTLSPVARPLFHRAIAISGSAASWFALAPNIVDNSRDLAVANLCYRPLSSTRTVDCLRKKSPLRLSLTGLAAPLVMERHVPGWSPRIDGELVSRDPREAMEEGLAGSHDLMLGHTQDDAAFLVFLNPLGMGYRNLLNVCRFPTLMKKLLKLMLNTYANSKELLDLVYKQYPDLSSRRMEERTKAAVAAVTDFLFGAPAAFEASHHARNRRSDKGTYLYQFSYRQSFLKYVSWVNGSHIDDLYSVFGDDFMAKFRRIILRKPYTEPDMDVRNVEQTFIANFAHTGNPNEGPHETTLHWPPYDDTDRMFMNIGLDSAAETLTPEMMESYIFWNKFYETAKLRGKSSRAAMDRLPQVYEFAAVLSELVSTFSTPATDDDWETLQKVYSMFVNYLE